MRNRSFKRFVAHAAFVVSALSFATPALSLTIAPAVSGLDQANGCASAACFPFNSIFSLPTPSPVSGTFDIVGTTLTFSIDLAGPATLVGNDGLVTSVDFTNVNYSGSFSVVPGVADFSFTDQSSTVSGTLTPNGAGSAVAFNIAGVNTTGSCTGTPGTSLVCGFQFGAGAGFAIDVNGNQRYFNHLVDINGVVPEPSSALMIGLGLTALAVRRRHA